MIGGKDDSEQPRGQPWPHQARVVRLSGVVQTGPVEVPRAGARAQKRLPTVLGGSRTIVWVKKSRRKMLENVRVTYTRDVFIYGASPHTDFELLKPGTKIYAKYIVAVLCHVCICLSWCLFWESTLRSLSIWLQTFWSWECPFFDANIIIWSKGWWNMWSQGKTLDKMQIIFSNGIHCVSQQNTKNLKMWKMP